MKTPILVSATIFLTATAFADDNKGVTFTRKGEQAILYNSNKDYTAEVEYEVTFLSKTGGKPKNDKVITVLSPLHQSDVFAGYTAYNKLVTITIKSVSLRGVVKKE
jgi:hypothetical protein